MTSEFRPEVEIRPLRASSMKNMQYNLYFWPNCLNFGVLKEIWVEEHDDDVIFQTGNLLLVHMEQETIGARELSGTCHLQMRQ